MCEAINKLPRLNVVCSKACEDQANEDLSTELSMKYINVMALGVEPSIDGSLLESEIDDLKKAQLRESRKQVCPGK